jgi:hypothetical protein
MLAIMGSQAAQAVNGAIPPGKPPNFDLGSSNLGYLFDTWGGWANPGVIVGFNPQPDPPGKPVLDIFDHTQIRIVQPGAGPFNFVIAFPGMAGLLLPAVAPPNVDGRTSFGFEYGGNVYDIGLAFAGPGPAGSWTWGAFNPQPDPPGIWESYQISFRGYDPSVAVTVSENGKYLNVGVAPELSTWAMMLIGFAGLGLAGRRAARKSAGLQA